MQFTKTKFLVLIHGPFLKLLNDLILMSLIEA